MAYDEFKEILKSCASQMDGFIALLADFLKAKAALHHPELQRHSATTVIDADTIWLKPAEPPNTFCGHAFATLAVNPVSRENRHPAQRKIKHMLEYCSEPGDMRKILTPFRWPANSPALQSFVMRMESIVGSTGGVRGGGWCGGKEYEVFMDLAWRCVNDWGLRAAFNPCEVHTIVPWYARGKPLLAGSANHDKWGMRAITQNPIVICVNAMWQTSRYEYGPPARSADSWEQGSLVRELVYHARGIACAMAVFHTAAILQSLPSATGPARRRLWHKTTPSLPSATEPACRRKWARAVLAPPLAIESWCEVFNCGAYTVDERAALALTSAGVARLFPAEVKALKEIARLRRCVCVRSMQELLEKFNLKVDDVHHVAGCTLRAVYSIKVGAVCEKLHGLGGSLFVFGDKVAGLAVYRMGFARAMGHEVCKAWDAYVRASLGDVEYSQVASLNARMLNLI